jgi:hypothetical protein
MKSFLALIYILLIMKNSKRAKCFTRLRIMDIALGIDIPVFVRGKRFGVEETISNVTPLEELTTTLRYMKAYGLNRVRGACFSNMILREASSSKLKPVQIYVNCFKSVHLRLILQK